MAAKSGKRRQARELALQMLFQSDMGKQNEDHVRKTFWAERADVDESTHGFADGNVEIDELIQKHAEHWRMERMPAVDRNLLRLGVAEFLGFPKTPRAIVINEALDIAHRYSSPESIQFINGVLDSIAKQLELARASS
jgi:N utilization substance protein B